MIFPHSARSIGDVENVTCTPISNSLISRQLMMTDKFPHHENSRHENSMRNARALLVVEVRNGRSSGKMIVPHSTRSIGDVENLTLHQSQIHSLISRQLMMNDKFPHHKNSTMRTL